jgi:Trypsin-co-occurring domain 1
VADRVEAGGWAFVLLRVPVEDGSAEYVEVEVERRDLSESVELVADDGKALVATRSLGASMDRLVPALRAILKRLRGDGFAPDEVGMEVGLKVGGETGLIFAKGTAEATFTVKLTWRGAAAPETTAADADGRA